MMENYGITISRDMEVHHFEIGEYMHHDEEKCKFRVFMNGVYVASFTPDDHNILHICQNPGQVDEVILHLLADEIESHHPHGMNKINNIRKLKL